ncbi:MAG: hypothetical protein CFE25_01810 [Chitinophagaceae bacterium BSSC1]|jgi:hypothetical protein|nr:MAG: hypothetical protein CFE25_01810 [Chitinophagaceae bacterium BSSC1]
MDYSYLYLNHLVYSEKVTNADCVIILEGDGFERIEPSVELIKNNISKNLVFSGGISKPETGSFPFEMCQPQITKLIEKLDCNLFIEALSMHTRQQALNIIEMALEKSWKSIILVASQYHQIRAFLTFLKVLEEQNLLNVIVIQNYPVLGQKWFLDMPWGNRFQLMKDEYTRIIEYTDKGHIATTNTAIEYYKWKESLQIKQEKY